MTLSPRKDGSFDRATNDRSAGDVDSDRLTFFRWYIRWANDEDAHRLNDEMPSLPVPATMGEAIDNQRGFEAEEAVHAHARQQRAAERDAQLAAETAMAAAKAEADQQALLRERAAQDAQRAAEDVERQRQEIATRAQEAAAARAQYQSDRARNEQSQRAYDCRMKRQAAASSAASKKPDDLGVYQRVWDSFHCPKS